MEKQKECFRCHTSKPLTDFYKHPQMPDGTVNKCKECNKAENRANWWLHRDKKIVYDRNRYRYSEDRMMKHKYKGIVNRCEGKHQHRVYTVTGMKYLTYSSFKRWWQDNRIEYLSCYEVWKDADFANKYAPSIDRIDPRKGYMPSNMQWLTFSVNCSKYNKVPEHLLKRGRPKKK